LSSLAVALAVGTITLVVAVLAVIAVMLPENCLVGALTLNQL